MTDSDSRRVGRGTFCWPNGSGPTVGYRPFDQVDLDDIRPALEAGMAMHLEEIDAIANNPEPPTFEEHDRRDGGFRA